jgi:hypothetical protein
MLPAASPRSNVRSQSLREPIHYRRAWQGFEVARDLLSLAKLSVFSSLQKDCSVKNYARLNNRGSLINAKTMLLALV